jgi:hypothetical protein
MVCLPNTIARDNSEFFYEIEQQGYRITAGISPSFGHDLEIIALRRDY